MYNDLHFITKTEGSATLHNNLCLDAFTTWSTMDN